MQPRIRDIEDGFGTCLRLSLAGHPTGALITLERRDMQGCPTVLLSPYGVDILCGFIMASRLSLPDGIVDEAVEGDFPVVIRLNTNPQPCIIIEQQDADAAIPLPANMWDRFYAELSLVLAHAQELARFRRHSMN